MQKVRIKWMLFFHSVLFSVAIFRLVALDVLPQKFNISIGRLQSYGTPTEGWEMVWLASGIVAVISAWATRNHHSHLLLLVIYGEWGCSSKMHKNLVNFIAATTQRYCPHSSMKLLLPSGWNFHKCFPHDER